MIQSKNNSRSKYLAKDWFYLTIILFFSVLAVSPLFLLGIPDGNKDFPQHLQFAAAYYKAIFNGDVFPTWAASDNFGFGSVGIRFYPPISSLSLALIKILTGNWFDALWSSFLVWMFAGCVGIYYWSREWLSQKDSTIAAVLYIIIPYHLLQIYQMWLYAEFVACAILPFCFLFITRICRRGKSIDILLFAVSYALLVLSHIPSTIIGSLSLAIYILFLLNWSDWRKTFLKLFAALLLSLSATAFYLIKVITEINWVKANSPQFSKGYYDPQQHLFPIFIRAGKKYIERVSWHFDVSILLTIFLFLPAIIYLGLRIKNINHKDKKIILALSATGLFSFFMMSLPSSFVWSAFPTLQKIQFPWRWLAVLSPISVLIFGFAISQLTSESRFIKKISAYSILLILSSVLLFDTTQNIIQSAPLPRTVFEEKLPELLNESGCDCWRTTWADSKAFERSEKVIANSRNVQISQWNDTTRKFIVEKGQPTDVRIATFYYPYWKAEVNNNFVEIEKDENGAMLIPIPAEIATVNLYFQEPLAIKIASNVSIIVWLLIFFAFLYLLQPKLTYFKSPNLNFIESETSVQENFL